MEEEIENVASIKFEIGDRQVYNQKLDLPNLITDIAATKEAKHIPQKTLTDLEDIKVEGIDIHSNPEFNKEPPDIGEDEQISEIGVSSTNIYNSSEKKLKTPRRKLGKLNKKLTDCPECGELVIFLKQHLKEVHSMSTFRCFCGKEYSKNESLKLHRRVVHDQERIKCKQCEKEFRQESHLKTHVESTHEKSCNPCDICGKIYPSQTYLKMHINNVHENKGTKPKQLPSVKNEYMCQLCGKSRSSNGILHHFVNCENYTEGVKYQCDSCEKTYSSRYLLKDHVHVTHKNNPIICSVCGKNFSSNLQLKKHMNFHDGIKFNCPHCDWVSTQKFKLPAHIKAVHEGLRYKCPDCKFFTPHPGNLASHFKVIHKSERKVSINDPSLSFTLPEYEPTMNEK